MEFLLPSEEDHLMTETSSKLYILREPIALLHHSIGHLSRSMLCIKEFINLRDSSLIFKILMQTAR